MIIESVKNIFYRKPHSLGEGLARIKQKYGINSSYNNMSLTPGKRKYVSSNNVIRFDTDSFTKEHKCLEDGVKSWTDTSRLMITNKNKKTQYTIDYNINHDNIGREVTPYRNRTVSKNQVLEHKTISEPTITLH